MRPTIINSLFSGCSTQCWKRNLYFFFCVYIKRIVCSEITCKYWKFYLLVFQITSKCEANRFFHQVGKIPWRRERLPTPVFWPGESHGLYNPWGHKESDRTEQLSLSCFTWGFYLWFLGIRPNSLKYSYTWMYHFL